MFVQYSYVYLATGRGGALLGSNICYSVRLWYFIHTYIYEQSVLRVANVIHMLAFVSSSMAWNVSGG